MLRSLVGSEMCIRDRYASKTAGLYGPKPKLMKWTYTGIIRPKLIYRCLVWGHKITKKKHGKKLNHINRIACMASTTITRITPQASLEIMTCTHPLDLFIKEVGMTAYIRLKNQLDKAWAPKKSFQIPHLQYWDNACENLKEENN